MRWDASFEMSGKSGEEEIKVTGPGDINYTFQLSKAPPGVRSLIGAFVRTDVDRLKAELDEMVALAARLKEDKPAPSNQAQPAAPQGPPMS